MRLHVFVSALLAAMLLASCAMAQETPFTGYNTETFTYQYVTFGSYPHSAKGETAPLLWRVLGPGVPGTDDVLLSEEVEAFNKDKHANGDEFTEETQDVFCLMTEHIIDTVLYHDVRDEFGGEALDYPDALIYDAMNGEIISRMFTAEEQSVLVDMPGRGKLSPASRKGELFRRDYGFAAGDFTKDRRRRATGTPYAFAQGLRHVNGLYSWYWTTDWRRYGSRWIVGDDGHISVSGLDRKGGIRPVCYVHADRLQITGGDGTMENPYQLAVR